MNQSLWLTTILFLPLLGGLAALAAHRRPELSRNIALVTVLMNLAFVTALTLVSVGQDAGSTGGWLFAEEHSWIESLGIQYSLGMDGISLMLILLTAFLIPVSVLVSWTSVRNHAASFYFFLLMSETAVIGLFLARDLFLFYLFWEIQIIPIFFLVGVWGHENRLRACLKFLMFTLAGSLPMLLAIIMLYVRHGEQTGVYTFSISQLIHSGLSFREQAWLYGAFLLALGIKIPIIPVHTWLPDTHTEAPTAGSVILAGLLLKTGAYALFRIAFPVFPLAAAASAPLLIVLGLAGLFYAGWVAFSQKDIKRLVAYSSIAHMGLVVIGLAVWNITTLHGAFLQMINHGLSTSALFVMIGMLNDRIDTRQMDQLGGLWKRMPVFSAFFMLFAMSSMGLPGLNNFIGEILILIGTYKSSPVIAMLGFVGMVITLLYILRMVNESLFGQPATNTSGNVKDLNTREIAVLGAMALAVIFIGLHPGPVLGFFDLPVRNLLKQASMLAGM